MIVDFFRALLKEQYTKLRFDGFLSELVEINNGIGQGESASMLLYLIYNHSLISIPEGPQENAGAHVDGTFFMAVVVTFEEM